MMDFHTWRQTAHDTTMREPELKSEQWTDWYSLMMCPWCGQGEGLHIDSVVMSSPSSAEHSIRLQAAGEDSGEQPIATRVPSTPYPQGRRQTITLEMWCEMCGVQGAVHLQQHKGQTMVMYSGRIRQY